MSGLMVMLPLAMLVITTLVLELVNQDLGHATEDDSHLEDRDGTGSLAFAGEAAV